MLVCGREEPIRPNDMIYQGTERPDRVVLSEFTDERLNRYSFVWLGPRVQASERLTRLLCNVLSEWNSGGNWLAAYETEGPISPRSRLVLAKRKKESWDIVDDGMLAIATRAVDRIEEDTTVDSTIRLSPRHELQYPGLRWDTPVLVIGAPFTAASMAHTRTRSVLARLATWRMAPTRRFLVWLARTERTLIYPERTDGDHPALIFVGTRRIDVSELMSSGLVSSIEDGESAASVWKHGPHWPGSIQGQ